MGRSDFFEMSLHRQSWLITRFYMQGQVAQLWSAAR